MRLPLKFLVFGCTLAACSTDLEINAPYKNVTVVEGLLNMRDSLQLIKINKGFLGEGDALVFAQIQDSNEWNSDAIEYARVVREQNGNVVATYELSDTILTNRAPGTFYSPEQRLYYFHDPEFYSLMIAGVQTRVFLDQESDYRLELKIKGEEISSSTTVVNDFTFQSADQNVNNVMNLMSGSEFGSFELNWDSNRDGKRYVAEYRFKYRERRNGVLGDQKIVTRRLGTVVKSGTGVSEPMSVTMDGVQFYENLASSIPNDPEVEQRVFQGIDFVVSVANDEFHTFLTLSEPVTGIIEDRPAYSNVANAYGIFGSRYTKSIISKRLGSTSLQQLADGDITGALRFCSDMPGDVNSPHYCP